MVKEFFKPATIDEALELLAVPGSLALAGGTYALAFEARDKPERVVDISRAVPRSIEKHGSVLVIGAGATFQEIIESSEAPAGIKAAAASMANRNTRNRATLGGNLGANKSCASLVPLLLALGATVEVKSRGKPAAVMPLADWLARPEGLVVSAILPLVAGIRAASLRSSRTVCDIATSTAACAYRLEGDKLTELHIALGGFGPHAALRPDLANVFEGRPLPTKTDIERAVLPLLSARADQRGSAEYKCLRADTLHAAEELS